MNARSDIHRPSVINPADYDFVGFRGLRPDGGGLPDFGFLIAERIRINAHMERTGGKYSQHAHGGSCHICGAHAIYTAIFHHRPTNVYLCTGLDCADKLECDGDVKAFRRATRTALEQVAGKRKAQALLDLAGHTAAWAIYEGPEWPTRDHTIVFDIVGKLVKYGSISDAQMAFVGRLTHNIINADVIAAQRETARLAAQPVPVNGERITVRGVIVSIKRCDPRSFEAWPDRMLVQHADGWKLWGSLPKALADAERGVAVEFSATVKRSDKDDRFGYFSRPTKVTRIAA